MTVSGVKKIKFRWYVGNCPMMGEGHVTLDRRSGKALTGEKEWAR